MAKVPARIRPAPVTTPPVLTSAARTPSRVPRAARLLARPGHQEDVVVDPEGDEEDERHQLEVEGQPFHPEDLGEGEGGEPEGGGEGGDDGRDQVGGGDQRPQHRDQDQADDEQDQRHDQLRVARVGLLDVEVLDRDRRRAARRGRRRAAVRGSLRPRLRRRCRRGRRGGRGRRPPPPRRRGPAPAATSWTESSCSISRLAAGASSALTTAVSGAPSPAGKCRSSASVPRLELVARVTPWPKPSVSWFVRLPRQRTASRARTATMIGPSAGAPVPRLAPRGWGAEQGVPSVADLGRLLRGPPAPRRGRGWRARKLGRRGLRAELAAG